MIFYTLDSALEVSKYQFPFIWNETGVFIHFCDNNIYLDPQKDIICLNNLDSLFNSTIIITEPITGFYPLYIAQYLVDSNGYIIGKGVASLNISNEDYKDPFRDDFKKVLYSIDLTFRPAEINGQTVGAIYDFYYDFVKKKIVEIKHNN